MENDDKLLRPGEVAETLGVDPKTVTRYANSGILKCVRLPGGHRRFRQSDVLALMTNN
jgi:excisionase family DNA binding protein